MTGDGPQWALTSVTRVDVVTADGRREFWADEWDVHLQDDGKTLKFIARGDGERGREERRNALREDLQRFGTGSAEGL